MSAATRKARREQAGAAAVAPARTPSPYVGLVPFSERDSAFFFGRSEESRNIAARLRGARLTLLYGPSGVGKSSVLRAGVVAHLIDIARHDLSERGMPDFAVVYFTEWTSDPLDALARRIRESVRRSLGQDMIDTLPPTLSLTQIIRAWTERYGIELLVILDQFEEYFLYHADEAGPGTFAHEFPEAVNQSNQRARFLISMRDDSLSKLDRFKGSIPALFDNRLAVEHLDLASACEAVVGPVKHYNKLYALQSPFKFDREFDPEELEALRGKVLDESQPFLLNKVLTEVQVGKVSIGVTGQGVVKKDEEAAAGGGAQPKAAIEAPYLQLVMTRIWHDEETVRSRELKAATLEKLGGSQKIVEQHLDKVMEGLSEEDQDAAAAVFYYLVTPSGTKIAHTPKTLSEWTRLPQDRVRRLLDSLLLVREEKERKKGEKEEDEKEEEEQQKEEEEQQKEEYRILRRVYQKQGKESIEAYEVYHDALAPAMLAWSAKHKSEQDRMRALDHEIRKQRRIIFWAVVLLFVVLAGFVLFDIIRTRANREEELRQAAEQNAEILYSQQKALDANAKTLQALVSLTSGSAEEKDAAVKTLQRQIELEEVNPQFVPLIKTVLLRLAQSQPQTETGKEAAEAAQQINKLTQQVQDTRISPRVYIQIQDEEQRPLAVALQQQLNASMLSDIPNVRPRIIAPGIDNVGQRRKIDAPELRYFHQTDLEKRIGEQLVEILKGAGLSGVQLKLIGGYEANPNIRPNHFELWLSADVR